MGNAPKTEVAQAKDKPPFTPKDDAVKQNQEPSPPPSKPMDNKATMLQLREFEKAVDKKTLEKAGLTEEQYRQFLKDYANLAQRKRLGDGRFYASAAVRRQTARNR